MKKILALGAEAEITLLDDFEGQIVVQKKRISKKYRLPVIDSTLITKRTKQESKILQKLQGIAPKLIKTEGQSIIMEYIQGPVIRDVLNENPLLAEKIGLITCLVHEKNIVHGDLTTSNMILDPQKNVRLIDFGLSFVSDKVEDKAVDLHLFKQAVTSKHYVVQKEIWKNFLKGYTPRNKKQILERLEKVEKRGKNKH